MEILPIKESGKIFLREQKENLLKNYGEEDIRLFFGLFDLYSNFFEESNFYLTPLKVIKMKEDVEEKAQKKIQNEEEDEDIKAVLGE